MYPKWAVNKSVIEMKATIRITLAVIVIFCTSCSTMKQNIHKNNKFTDKTISSLLEKNGNVFYITSTYSTGSVVWTYNENGIEIYKLVKGKVIRKEVFPVKETWQFNVFAFRDIETELYQKCGLELDGDLFGFSLYVDNTMHKEDFAVDISCLKTETYKSEFLNKVVEDINTYKMYNVW